MRLAGLVLFLGIAVSPAMAQETWERTVNKKFGYAVSTVGVYAGLSEFPGEDGETRHFGSMSGTDVSLTVRFFGVDNYASDLAGWVDEARASFEGAGWTFSADVGADEATYAAAKDNERFDARVLFLCDMQSDFAVVTTHRESRSNSPEVAEGVVPEILASLERADVPTTCGN